MKNSQAKQIQKKEVTSFWFGSSETLGESRSNKKWQSRIEAVISSYSLISQDLMDRK